MSDKMVNIISGIILILILAGIAYYKFGHSTVVSMFQDTVKSKQYNVEANGLDLRVVEFGNRHNEHCTVLMRSSTGTAPTMVCK